MSSIWQAIRDNCYNLSRNDIGTLRKLQEDPSSSPLAMKSILSKLSKGELTSFEGIVWVNAFLDLIYVMVIFKIDEILGKCSQQPDRSNDMEAAVNVYIVAIVFFVLMFFTRYQMDFYASSFMQLTSTKTYPLLQADLFHRSMVVCYGLGMFIMTMNINLEELHGELEKKNNAFLVGSCKFVPQYSLGFASGFLITRGLMCLMYLALMMWAADPIIRVKYRGTFFFKIIRNVLSMVLIAGLFANVSDIKSTNELNISLLTLVAIIEVSGEFLLTSINQIMRHWFRIPETSSFFLEYIRFNSQPEKSRDAKRSDFFPYDSYEKIHESFELFCDANVLQERLSLFFMLILGESFLGVLYLAYDAKNETAFLVQVLVYFLVVSTGTLFFETVDKSVEIPEEEEEEEENEEAFGKIESEHRQSRQISLASTRSRLSMDKNSVQLWREKQKAEKLKKKVHQHGLLAPYPYSYLFVWMHVVVAFTLLLATCGIVGLYSNSSLNLPQRHKNVHNANTTMPSAMPTSQPTSSMTVAALDTSAIASSLSSSVLSKTSIFSPFFPTASLDPESNANPQQHSFFSFEFPSFSWQHPFPFQFSKPAATHTSHEPGHSRPSVTLGFDSSAEPVQTAQNLGSSGDDSTTDDAYYYYDDIYTDDSLNFPEYPSLTISEWQMAIGLCLTALGCMVMRIMHRDIRALAASAAAKLSVPTSSPPREDLERARSDSRSRENGSENGVSTPTTKLSWYQQLLQAGHIFYQYYFLEVMTVGAAVGHILVYVAFHNYQPASDATFLLFAWHTIVNVALSSVHLVQKLTTVQKIHRHTPVEDEANSVSKSQMVNNPLNSSSNTATSNVHKMNNNNNNNNNLRLSAQEKELANNALRQRPRYVSNQDGTEMT